MTTKQTVDYKKSYKQTELGLIPKDWEVARLSDIFVFANGQRPDFDAKGIVPVYGANGIMGYTKKFMAENNYILIIGRVGASGEIHLARGKAWISDNAIFSKQYISSRIYPLFMFYYLKFLKLKRFASQTTHPILTQSFLKHLLVPLPYLKEQKKIAVILSTVDEGIGMVDDSIAKTERLKKGLMQRLLTKGIGHKEFKQTEIGLIPKDWEPIKLGEIVSLEYGQGLPEKLRRQGKYQVVGSNGVVGLHNKFLIKGPGIVVGRKGTIGGITWLSADFWPIDTTYFIRLKKKHICLKWLYFLLVKLNLCKLGLSDVVPGLKRELVYALKISLPSYEEQKKIAEILSTVDKRLELLKQRREKLQRIKKGLMNDLLTGRKRVIV